MLRKIFVVIILTASSIIFAVGAKVVANDIQKMWNGKDSLDDVESVVVELTDIIIELDNEISALEEQKTTLEDERDALLENNNNNTEEIERLNSEIVGLDNKINLLEVELTNAELELATAKTEIKHLEDELDEANKDASDLLDNVCSTVSDLPPGHRDRFNDYCDIEEKED